MLILTRKSGESITIGDNIKIQVVEIKGRQVRIGINAPKDFSIHREEIYIRIKSEGKKEVKTTKASHSLERLTEVLKPDL